VVVEERNSGEGGHMKLLVLGGGVAGLVTALAASRGGHQVVLAERDTDTPVGDAAEVFESWQRTGVAQFRQPHNFLGLGRRLLRDRAPDLYRSLLASGAVQIEQFRFLAGAAPDPGDEDLATIGCRRPVFEAALRRAVQAEPTIDLRPGCRVTGLVQSGGHPAHVEGAVLAGGERLAADLVVDATGRSSRAPAWLADAGLGPVAERSSGCGLIYYSRHFQRRDGVPDPPYASVLAGPRGDLGYVAYAIFVGDSRTFAVIFMAPPWDRAFRDLRHPEAYMRAARLLPGVAAWIDPDAALPITPVMPFGQVTNTVRHYLTAAGPVAPGLQPIGDALCHTNPSFAFGASMALHQAFTLADLLAVAADHQDLARRFAAAVGEDLRDRHRAVAEEDRDRARWWGGEPIDVTDPAASMALFLRAVVYRVAPADPRLLRAVVRRVDLLDPPDRLEQDRELHALALELYNSAPRPSGPSRSQMLQALAA
jgi:2-polyprenyl-6-methoxyphenol hydroxylase-like FAD-dependent oxidoreductase